MFSSSGDHKALTRISVWRIVLSGFSFFLCSRHFPFSLHLSLVSPSCLFSLCSESLYLLLSVSPSVRAQKQTACTSGRWGNAGLLHSWALNRAEQPMPWLPLDESVHVMSWIRAATVTKLLCVASHLLTVQLHLTSILTDNHVLLKFFMQKKACFLVWLLAQMSLLVHDDHSVTFTATVLTEQIVFLKKITFCLI